MGSTVTRAHTSTPQEPAGGRAGKAGKTQKGGLSRTGRSTWEEPRGLEQEAAPLLLRRGKGCPLSVVVTPGQRHESTQLEAAVLAGVRVARPEGSRGRPRKRPERLIADKGYSYPSCWALLRRRGIPYTIPERRDQRERRSRRPGRPPAGFDDTATYLREAQRVREVYNRLKQWRGVATRYEKRAANYRAMVVIAALRIWLSCEPSDTP